MTRDNGKRRIQKKINELNGRIAVANAILKELETMQDDPRQPDAVVHYQAQRAELERCLAVEKAKLEGPKEVVIGLQPAQLFARKG